MINFNSQINHKILSFFFLNSQRSLYLRELANILEIDNANLSRYLNSLLKEGILISENKGRQKYYSLNKKYPMLTELKKLVSLNTKPKHLIGNALKKLSGLKKAFIFGSYASGKFRKDSDLDLILVGEHDIITAREYLLTLEKRLGREINTIDYSLKEYQQKLKEKDSFLYKVAQDKKIILI